MRQIWCDKSDAPPRAGAQLTDVAANHPCERGGMQFAAASFMRTLIILSIVVLLKIEQQLARGLVQRALPRRHRRAALRQ
jgi:hypothetical protein